MEKIRLPEDFTDRVMQKIEQRERAAARRAVSWEQYLS